MFYALYTWELNESLAAQFVGEWERVTVEVYENCGSYGARLFRDEEGLYYSIAKWNSKSDRDNCSILNEQGEAFDKLMDQCINTKFISEYGEKEEDVLPQKDLELILNLSRDRPFLTSE